MIYYSFLRDDGTTAFGLDESFSPAGAKRYDDRSAWIEAQEFIRNNPPDLRSGEQKAADREREAKAECKRRIYAVADAETQMNLAANRAAGNLSEEDKVVYEDGLLWISAMQEASRTIAADGRLSIDKDENWPSVNDAVRELASRF